MREGHDGDRGGAAPHARAMPSTVDVVVRCRNEMPYVQRALEGLMAQRAPAARVLFVDNGSTDGSREAAARAEVRVHDVEAGSYKPGRVLNQAMGMTQSPVVAFVNADAVPLHPNALGLLVAPLLRSSRYAASYGRQRARSDASRLTRREYERTFAPEGLRVRYGQFFSMAASALRRDVWEAVPFDERLQYSEDVDWVYRVRALGWAIHYVPEAEFEHSHDYDLRGHFRRRRGEGTADRLIYRLGPPAIGRDLVWPLAGSVLRDVRARHVTPAVLAARIAQAGGYYAGRRREQF